MATTLDTMLLLQEVELLSPGKNLLDVGRQNLFFLSKEQAFSFFRNASIPIDKHLENSIDKLIASSNPEASEQTSFLGQLLELVQINYVSLDISPGFRTEICDLNCHPIPFRFREQFEIVLNLGTSEHIVNQLNVFKVMHDAARTGGIIYCVLPLSGYWNHGYFCYTPKFFLDLAIANDYEVIDRFICHSASAPVAGFDIRSKGQLQKVGSGVLSVDTIESIDVHIILQKRSAQQFKAPLDLSASHSAGYADALKRCSIQSREDTIKGKPKDSHFSFVHQTAVQARRNLHDGRQPLDEALAQVNRLYHEKEARLAERDQAIAERDEAYLQMSRLDMEWKRAVSNFEGSTSWRITAPGRYLRRLFSR
jgi:SAM-dependent methyltransferase